MEGNGREGKRAHVELFFGLEDGEELLVGYGVGGLGVQVPDQLVELVVADAELEAVDQLSQRAACDLPGAVLDECELEHESGVHWYRIVSYRLVMLC